MAGSKQNRNKNSNTTRRKAPARALHPAEARSGRNPCANANANKPSQSQRQRLPLAPWMAERMNINSLQIRETHKEAKTRPMLAQPRPHPGTGSANGSLNAKTHPDRHGPQLRPGQLQATSNAAIASVAQQSLPPKESRQRGSSQAIPQTTQNPMSLPATTFSKAPVVLETVRPAAGQ